MVKKFDGRLLAKTEKKMEKTLFSIFRPQNDASSSSSDLVRDRRVNAWIGCSVSTAAKVWLLLMEILVILHGREANMEKLCWALYMLKNYPEDVAAASKVGAADEQTFSHWLWIMLKQMSYLVYDVVSCLHFWSFSIVADNFNRVSSHTV